MIRIFYFISIIFVKEYNYVLANINSEPSRVIFSLLCLSSSSGSSGWSGGAMVLGKLPVPGRPTIWIIVGQGPIALVVGAGGVVWTFLFSSILSLLFHPLFGRRPDLD